jgi:hypothetical protein
MAAEVGKIQFKVGLKGQGEVKKEVQTLQSDVVGKLGSSFGKLGGLIAAAFSVAAVVSFAKECRAAYDTSVEMQTKLETVMRQRMKATDEEIEKIRELNSVLQSRGVVEDDIAAAGAQQLATFLNTSSSLETLIPAMENLVAQQKGFNATTSDAVNVGNLMGKVMQGQTSALTRVGITFTEAQEAVLKYGNEQERAAMLAQVITDNVGNMNEALGNTPQGKMLQMKNTWGDIQENIGNILTSGIYPFLDGLNTMLGYLNAASAKLAEMAQSWAGLSGITLPSVSNSLGEVEEDVIAVGEAANKTVFGFDNLNKLASQSASGGGSSKPTNQGGGELTNLNTTQTTNGIDNIGGSLKNLIDIAKTLGDMFGTAFNVGILTPFKNHSDDIRGIFQDLQGFTQRIASSFEDFTSRASVKMDEFANGRFKTACEEMGVDLDKALSMFFAGYEKYIEPALERVTENFEGIFGEGGTMDQALDTILEDIAIIMENSGWLMSLLSIVGVVAGLALTTVANMFMAIVEFIVESVEAGFEMIAGLSLLLEGIFTGSFEKIKEGFAKLIESFIMQIQAVVDAFNGLTGMDLVFDMVNEKTKNIQNPFVATNSTNSKRTSGPTTNRNDRVGTTHNATIITLDKHILGQVLNTTNNKNQTVIG